MNDPIQVASCVITDDYGRLLLMHRDYNDMQWWETPGGKVEEDESVEAAAARELREELGVAVAITAHLGKAVIELDDEVYEMHWLKAEIVQGEPRIVETDKFDDLDYIDIEDLPSLALSPGTLQLHEQLLTGDVQF